MLTNEPPATMKLFTAVAAALSLLASAGSVLGANSFAGALSNMSPTPLSDYLDRKQLVLCCRSQRRRSSHALQVSIDAELDWTQLTGNVLFAVECKAPT